MDVRKLAQAFDCYVAVNVGWQTGDEQEFEQWLKRYEIDSESHLDLLETLNQAHIFADAISECGGGKDAVYWYDFGRVIIGIPNTTRTLFVIPANADMPKVISEDEDD